MYKSRGAISLSRASKDLHLKAGQLFCCHVPKPILCTMYIIKCNTTKYECNLYSITHFNNIDFARSLTIKVGHYVFLTIKYKSQNHHGTLFRNCFQIYITVSYQSYPLPWVLWPN